MTATSLQLVDRAGLVAHDYNRLAAASGRHEVARLRQLAFMRDPDPRLVEDAFELFLE